jgi:hypothetical protein
MNSKCESLRAYYSDFFNFERKRQAWKRKNQRTTTIV